MSLLEDRTTTRRDKFWKLKKMVKKMIDEVKRAQDTIRGSFFPAQKQTQQLCVPPFAVLDPRV